MHQDCLQHQVCLRLADTQQHVQLGAALADSRAGQSSQEGCRGS